MNLSLVSFDEKSPIELLELLNEVLGYLDTKHEKIDIREEAQDETANRLTEFIKILNYPSNFDLDFARGLVYGDKKIIYPVLYYILSQLPQMQQRAYLARFLVNIYVPDDYLMEEDMRIIFQQYKEFQAEFQVIHQDIEQQRLQAMPPNELRNDIEQLEAEKDQLTTKINGYKNKYSGNDDFYELYESTSMLRKEQEEEARLMEKIQEQQQLYEISESSLLQTSQRLVDVKKAISGKSSAMDMLNIVRNDVKRNREYCNERIGRELNEKIKRLEQVERIINEPHVSQNDIDQLQNEVRILQREVQMLEDKANNSQAPADDKLAFFKQQAAMVSKKKEKSLEKVKNLEQEANRYEKKMMEKEHEYQKVKGGNKFMSRDEFTKFAQQLRAKKNQFQQMKSQLRDIRAELTVINRTEKITKTQFENQERAIMEIERKYGVQGFTQAKDDIEKISGMKQEIDLEKGATLEEISKIVEELDGRLKQNRARLAPLVNELRNTRAQYQELNTEHAAKKQQYETATASFDTDRNRFKQEVSSLEEETNGMESRFHLLSARIAISDAWLARVSKEESCRKGEQRVNQDFSSFKDWYGNKLGEQNSISTTLRSQQKFIKETHMNNSEQVKMFQDLQNLLVLKMRVMNEGGGQPMGQRGQDLGGESGAGGVNRLVLND